LVSEEDVSTADAFDNLVQMIIMPARSPSIESFKGIPHFPH
jgi:hypothetical protein